MVQPSTRELAEKIGLKTRAALPYYDLIVIGGGPAGLAAAVYGASEGLRTILMERDAPGGQAGTSSKIENYLGFPLGVSGSELTRRATGQAQKFGAEILSAIDVVEIRRLDPYRIAVLSDGATLASSAIVIASGMEVRRLEAPGVGDLVGAGVYYGAALTEAALYRDKRVYLVGGANSAGQGAVFFSRFAKRVTLVLRAKDLNKSMSKYLIDRIAETKNIEMLPHTVVNAVGGNDKLETITLADLDTSETREVDADALFIFIGSRPRT